MFSLETASDYVKDEKASFYGFKCFAIGYEFSQALDEVSVLYNFSSINCKHYMIDLGRKILHLVKLQLVKIWCTYLLGLLYLPFALCFACALRV